MADEEEWRKLSGEQKAQHKSWKARSEGYKECIKNFKIYDEKSPEFSKYLGLIKKFVTDPNELVRAQGLEAAIAYVENAHVAGKTSAEVVSGVVAKCFNSKPKLKELGSSLCLMYVEIDKNEQVQEELLKAFENKQPKVVHAAVEVLTQALREFGAKVIPVKPMLKQALKLVDHRDKNVREATKALFIEIYRWIGGAIRVPLQGINSVTLKDLEEEWEKIGQGGQATQTRFMRSQKDLRQKFEEKADAGADAQGEGDGGTAVEAVEIDPYDLLEPVEILSKLPKPFYEQIESKKWQERREMLEACEKLVQSPKLVPGDYGDLVRVLKKVMQKDTNILLVVIAVKCIGFLAKGLRKKFQPYALVCLEGVFDRFKEKKANVVTALQETSDAVYLTTNVQAIHESCIEYLGHKNPSIRAQTGFFLQRALVKSKAAAINKALLKTLVPPLLRNMDHGTPEVREAAYQAIGAMFKLVGESKVAPFLGDIDKLKMDKINECVAAMTSGDKEPAEAAQAKKPVAKPAEEPAAKKSAVASKPPGKADGGKKVVKGKAKPKSAQQDKPESVPEERELGDDAVEEQVATVISSEEKAQVLNTNWKERLAGLEATFQKVKMLEPAAIPCQALLKFLTIKPGWKDNNFNCLNEKFKILQYVAVNGKFSKTSGEVCLTATVDKVGDIKCGKAAHEALTAIAEATSLPWVSERVLDHAMAQKNPKIQSESLRWMSAAIVDFGIAGVNVKLIIEKTKAALAATNPAVRSSGLSLTGTLALYVGEKLRMFFESEKPALLQQIDAEIEKVKGKSPPAPTKGIRKKSGGVLGGKGGNDGDGGEDVEEETSAVVNLDDMVTRIDISGKITDQIITQMASKNWKERKEGLDSVVEILNESKFVEPNLGDLPTALKGRLTDSNKILLMTTLNILMQLAEALGPHCLKHLSTFKGGIIGMLADSKPQLRQAAIKCMDAWLQNTKLSLWLEDDEIASALAVTKHTFLRIELTNWLCEKLLAINRLGKDAKEQLEQILKVVYACCEDRSGEVRAKAQAILPAFMKHIPYDKMLRVTGKLPAASRDIVAALLEKAREQMPQAPPAPASENAKTIKPPVKSAAAKTSKDSHIEAEVIGEAAKAPQKPLEGKKMLTKTVKKASAASSRKPAAEDDAPALFIPFPNGKQQRMKDEVKRKTLKWAFAAPVDELIEQLQMQLSKCVGSSLISEMFHKDFQHHLKAIVLLSQAIETDWESTMACLDVLLRWFTLRLYDKNTTVHIKSLEYLGNLFKKLCCNDYRMSDYEAMSFIPHLLTKIGDSKDNIRREVHAIVRQLTMLHAASKIYVHLMDATKSKNARQRSESIDEVSFLIETYGIEVCQPTPPQGLKEIASLISDRDKSVRSSALNAIVSAYNACGEIVFKHIGKLKEKELSMLEERIKRTGKFVEATDESQPPAQAEHLPPTEHKKPLPIPSQTTSSLDRSANESSVDPHNSALTQEAGGVADAKDEDEHYLPENILKLYKEIKQIDTDKDLPPMPLPPPKLPDWLEEELANRKISPNALATVDIVISKISSPNVDTCITAVHELYEVLKNGEKRLLHDRVDQIVTAGTSQLRMMYERYLPAVVMTSAISPTPVINERSFMSLFRSFFALMVELFGVQELSCRASVYVLFDFMRNVILIMISEKLSMLPNSGKLIQSLNLLFGNMVKYCDPTAMMCATVQVLADSMTVSTSNYTELILKCLWKLIRQIPTWLNKSNDANENAQTLKVADVLAEMDKFWRTYPRGHPAYARFEAEVPLQSIKTALSFIYKSVKNDMVNELYMVPNTQTSDVVSIVAKFTGFTVAEISAKLAQGKKENMKLGSISQVSTEAKLSMIFKKIGNRSQSKQGILELYEFQQEHPGYDINPQIDSFDLALYRNYIRRQLKIVAVDKNENYSESERQRMVFDMYVDELQTNDRWNNLNELRATCGLEPIPFPADKQGEDGKEGESSVLTQTTDMLNSNRSVRPSVSSNQGESSTDRPASRLTRPGGDGSSAAGPRDFSELKRRYEELKMRSSGL